jgi:histidinol-phosphatase (PHP family)
MFDTHVHTKFSTDSEMAIEDAIASAAKKNRQIIITEHMDINFPEEGSFIFDVDEYFNQYIKYRSENVLLGVEIGMKDDCIEESGKLVIANPFDYVIGSVHLVENYDLYYEDYYRGKEKKDAYDRYLKSMLLCVKNFHFIDSMGHIDYIARYAHYDDKELYYSDHSHVIDEILKTLIINDKCIEINTKRFDRKTAVNNLLPIYKRYAELGGKHVTVGSDSHKPGSIGSSLDLAKEFADECKLKIVYFKERKMEYENV